MPRGREVVTMLAASDAAWARAGAALAGHDAGMPRDYHSHFLCRRHALRTACSIRYAARHAGRRRRLAMMPLAEAFRAPTFCCFAGHSTP